MDVTEIIARWKEFGALGAAILLLAKLGDKAFVWLLEVLGVRIKRSQSREDEQDAEMKKLRSDMDEMKEEMAQMRAAVGAGYEVAKSAADGIEQELIERELTHILPTIMFFVKQLRTIKPLEEIAKSAEHLKS